MSEKDRLESDKKQSDMKDIPESVENMLRENQLKGALDGLPSYEEPTLEAIEEAWLADYAHSPDPNPKPKKQD
jgi:hypothetical protein